MVVIRNKWSDVETLFGKEWEVKIQEFSRVIGFTFEKDDREIKIELNPDRPDLYSLLSIQNAMSKYHFKNIRNGNIGDLDLIINEETVRARPYLALFRTKSPIPDSIANLLRTDFLDYADKLSETVGKQRKKFAVGVHDANKVNGPISYAHGKGNTQFKTFDGVEGTLSQLMSEHEKGKKYGDTHNSNIIILQDKEGIISVPPMFNSFRTRVDNTTSRYLVDITATSEQSLKLACKLLMGYFLSKGIDIDLASTKNVKRSTVESYVDYVTMDVNNLEKLSGIKNFEIDSIKNILNRMGYTFSDMIKEKALRFKVPFERIDVMGEVDVIEDYLKSYGFSNITERVMLSTITGSPSPSRELENNFRYLLASANFQEIKSFILSKESFNADQIRIKNPKSEDFSTIRDTLWHGLMSFLELNRSASYPQRLFEIGEIINNGNQETRVACISCGPEASYSEIKGVLDLIIKSTGIEIAEVKSERDAHFIEGRCAKFHTHGLITKGIIGEVSPKEITEHQLTLPVSYLEFSIGV